MFIPKTEEKREGKKKKKVLGDHHAIHVIT